MGFLNYLIRKLPPVHKIRLLPGLKGINKYSFENVPRWITEIPDHLKTQEMCDEAVGIEPRGSGQERIHTG